MAQTAIFAGLVVGAVYLFGMLWQLTGRSAIGQWHYLLSTARQS